MGFFPTLVRAHSPSRSTFDYLKAERKPRARKQGGGGSVFSRCGRKNRNRRHEITKCTVAGNTSRHSCPRCRAPGPNCPVSRPHVGVVQGSRASLPNRFSVMSREAAPRMSLLEISRACFGKARRRKPVPQRIVYARGVQSIQSLKKSVVPRHGSSEIHVAGQNIGEDVVGAEAC